MAVYRVNKNRGYTVMANYHLRDKTLSLKAVGLLSKMLSFNDGWQFSTKGLSAICKEARMLFWQLSGSLRIMAILSVTGRETPRAE